MRRSYFVVEGPHDVEFVARLLPRGYSRVQSLSALEEAWRWLVPTKFPHRDDLLRRVPVPTFFASATHTLAIDSASGVDNLVMRLEESMSILAANQVVLDGVGVILDADEQVSPAARHAEIRAKLVRLPRLGDWPGAAGAVYAGPPRCGAFVLPDNVRSGSLEDLMLEVSAVTYPGLHNRAVAYVSAIDGDGLEALGLRERDLRDFRKPSGDKKAVLACVANVLRPGKALQTAIQDCRWLAPEALELPRLEAVQRFVHDLLGVAA